MTLIKPDFENGTPLCPNVHIGPVHPAHAEQVRIEDMLYKALPKDAEGELTSEADRITEKTNLYSSKHMNLFHTETSWTSGGRQRIVEAYYYMCRTCGLILPANRIEDR